MIDRRTFITLLGAGTLAAPCMAGAQQASVVRVGWLTPESRPEALNPFLQALKELGWTEGGNLTIEQRYSHGDADRYPELAAAFALAVKKRAGGVLVLASTHFSSQAPRIVSLAAKTRLPAIYDHQGFVDAGGLMSYGPSPRDTFRRIAGYVDRVLKGAKPANLPVEQPTKLELAVNLKTAKALGLTIPQALLLRVDQVVQ